MCKMASQYCITQHERPMESTVQELSLYCMSIKWLKKAKQRSRTNLLAPGRGIHVVVGLRRVHFWQQETSLQRHTMHKISHVWDCWWTPRMRKNLFTSRGDRLRNRTFSQHADHHDLDLGLGHVASTSTYIPNLVEIGRTFCGWIDVRALRPAL